MNPDLTNIVLATILGITFAVCLFCTLSIFCVPGFFEKLWKRITRPLGIALVIGWAVISMAAVTQLDLTSQVKGILPSANGGTGSAFFGITGPTALRVFTLPDAAATVLTSNAAVTVAQGGTSLATLTAHCVVTGEGTSTPVLTCPGSSGQVLTSTGASTDPTFQTPAAAPSFGDNLVPTGTINGSNTAFTLANTPNPAASLNCFLNGVQQRAAGADFTLATATVTFGVAPPTGSSLVCSYRF